MFSLACEMMIAILRIILYIFYSTKRWELNDIRINDRELKKGSCFVDKKIILNDYVFCYIS